MATRFDVAQRLFQPQRAASYALRSAQRAGGIQGGQTGSLGMSYGTAAGDSEGGWVQVAMDTSGMVDPDDAPTVSCVCDTPIKDGQRVAVLTTSSGQLKAIPIGDNIADMSIRDVDVQYALSSSSTQAPSSGWSSTPPSTIPDGQYLWQRTATTSGTGEVSYSAAVCITSGDGKDGRGVEDIQEQYYLSTSSTRQTGGSWQSTCPEWVDGRYIWTRSRIEWTDGTTTYTTPVLASAINQANENAAKATQYCWNDYEGTHVSTSPNSTSGSNVLLDSEGLAIRHLAHLRLRPPAGRIHRIHHAEHIGEGADVLLPVRHIVRIELVGDAHEHKPGHPHQLRDGPVRPDGRGDVHGLHEVRARQRSVRGVVRDHRGERQRHVPQHPHAG